MAKLAEGDYETTLHEMYQNIDLASYLGRDPTPKEKDLFAEAVIEKINDRTLDGKQLGGGKFKQYTQEYADFKGVPRTEVDLFLEGDMLEDIERDKSLENENSVAVAMSDSLEIKKGFNHHTGDTLPKRKWFGVTDNEVRKIVRTIKQDSSNEKAKKKKTTGQRTLSDLRNELSKLGIIQTE